ncbi:MAG: hypothetical protein ACK5Y8_16240 [Betaproteobacteria bacterium]
MPLEASCLAESAPNLKPAVDDQEQSRLRAAAQVQAHEIQSVDVDTLGRLKALAGHGERLLVWSTPQEWLVNAKRSNAIMSVDLQKEALSALTADERAAVDMKPVSGAVASMAKRLTPAQLVGATALQAVRYLLLMRLGPSLGSGRRSGKVSLKAASVAETASGAIRRMVAIVIRKRLDLVARGLLSADDTRHFALIQPSDFATLPKTFAARCATELRRMDQLCGRGVWLDAPMLERDPTATVDPAQPPKEAEPDQKPDPHLPLPDDYVAQMGQRSLWIIEHLGPFLLDVGEELLTEWRKSAHVGNSSKSSRKKILLSVLAARNAGDPTDLASAPLRCPEPPFTIRLSTHGEKAGRRFKSAAAANASDDGDADECLEPIKWPPHNLAHFTGLCGVLQGAHFFIASMAMAARQSESMDLRRDCVVYGNDGQWRAAGRTFKLVQAFEGEIRDWDLPEAAARAIEQQARLARMLEQMPWTDDLSALLNPEFTAFKGDHLWCRIGSGGTNPREVPRDPNKFLRKFARMLDMDAEPSGQPLRTHRFRKTIARLAALAIDEAPLMLKHLFGHKDIEMTLHYILADKALAAEIEQIIKELHMMRAKAPVEAFVARLVNSEARKHGADEIDVDYAGYGGKAVDRLADTVERYRDQAVAGGRMRNSSEDFGADQIDDVVRILTGDGTYFNLVRPGVFCTKRLGEWGPCSRKKGQADRSNCQETCDHRLEEPWLRADADGCVADALAGYERAMVDDEVLLQSFWADQVRRNVVRFEDLRAKWMQHPVIAQIMAASEPLAAKAA